MIRWLFPRDNAMQFEITIPDINQVNAGIRGIKCDMQQIGTIDYNGVHSDLLNCLFTCIVTYGIDRRVS